MHLPAITGAIATAVLAIGAPGVLPGQARAAVEGRVVDAVGRPLAGAEVVIERPGLPSAGRAVSDADGGWRVTHLAAGRYRVSARRVGFRAASEDVVLAPGGTARVTFVLEQSPFQLDSLVVSAPAVRIATENTELATRLTIREISLLPTTLDMRPLIGLTPGARPDHLWGGASDQANSYRLDGAVVNHAGQGGAFLLPSPAWIESLEVRGLGAGAEHGDFQGGLVEITTLGGGDRLEGSFRTGVESRQLNGSNLIAGEIGRELVGRWELDAQLRGPLPGDRLHFALFGRVIRQEERVLNHLPDPSDEFVPVPPSLLDGRWLAKLSWKPGDRDLVQASLMGRHQNGDREEQTGYEAAEATVRLRETSFVGGLTWQRSWSPRSAVEVRLGGYVSDEERTPYGGPAVPGIEILTPVNPPRYQNAPFRTLSQPSSISLTTIWTQRGRLAGLEHELKLGGEYTLGGFDFERTRNAGMTWRPLRVLGFDPADPGTWSFGGIGTAWGGEARLDSRMHSTALFVQDRIRLGSRLQLHPGFRLGWWSGALTPPQGPRFTAVGAHGLEPRIGLVADLDGRGDFVAKAHWGRYHQSMFAALFDRVEGAASFSNEEIWTWLGPPPQSPAGSFTLAEREAQEAAGGFRFEEEVRLDQAGRVEDYRQPYVDQTVLSLERVFGGRWRVGLAYVFRQNHDMVALVDRNLASNYTVVENVVVRDRFGRQVFFGGKPLVLERLAISNEDILRVQELLRQGVLTDPRPIYLPPGVNPATLRYDPDYVLTTVPEATRRFRQFQLRLEGRYRTWWLGGSATLTTLKGNYNVVTGPDDYAAGGPGPWVRLNEQFNFSGALNNQSRFEGKLHVGGLLPAGFRGGAFFSLATGDRVTPTLTLSGLLTDFAPTPAAPAPDTASFHRLLFQSTRGHRIFLEPRGSYRYQSRASLDLHLERSFPRGRAELVVAMDGFNLLGDRSVTAIETHVNTMVGVFDSDYRRVRGRVSPRTLRLTAGIRF